MLDPHVLLEAKKRLLQLHWKAQVGHLGSNLSCLEALLTLFSQVKTPADAFVLSKGHAVGALYVTLWSLGLLSEEDLATFYQEGTSLPAHPPLRAPKGCELLFPFATGSLGHGLSLACGMALGRKLQQLPGQVFCLTSDGEWQEGSTWEALIFWAHHQLTSLTVLVDVNGWQGFGSTQQVASMQDLEKKLASFPLEVVTCPGHDTAALEATFRRPLQEIPRLVLLQTVKGKGIPDFEDQLASHYLPLSQTQYESALKSIEIGHSA